MAAFLVVYLFAGNWELLSVVGWSTSADFISGGKRRSATNPIKAAWLHAALYVAIISSVTFGSVNADAADPQGKLIVGFSGSRYTGDKQPWNQFGFTDFQSIAPAPGMNGLIGYVGRFNRFYPIVEEEWNFGIFARFGATNKAIEGAVSSPLNNILGGTTPLFNDDGRVTHQEQHFIADIEARHNLGTAPRTNAQTTVHAGLRFGQFIAETDTIFLNFPVDSLREHRQSKFVGLGPRVGLEHQIPLTSNLVLDLSASASMLYGQKSTDVTTVVSAPIFSNQTSRDRFDWVPMFDGRLGLKIAPPNSPTTLSIGVEASAWMGVYDQQTAFTIGAAPVQGNRNADRYSVGPYVRLTTLLGEGDTDIATFTSSKFDNSSSSIHRGPVMGLSLWGGYLWRFGNALNQSGAPRTEIEDFSLGGLEVLAATPLTDNWQGQFEALGEATFDNHRFGSLLADETYGGGHQFGGHLSFIDKGVLFGLFGGIGRTEINDNGEESLDTQFKFAGLEGRLMSTYGSIALQGGFLNSSVVDDHESFDDAVFARAIAQLFFNDGKTMIEGNLAYAEGLQDSDDFLPNPANIFSWGVELEQQLPVNIGMASTALFASIEGVRVEESSTSGDIDRVEESTVLAGLKIRFGTNSPYHNAYNSAPELPNVLRWLGAVPSVD